VKACIKRLAAPAVAVLLLSANVLADPWTVNFKDSDIQEVILFVADATGKTIIIDPKVRGQVKVVSARPVNTEELYALFLSILDVHGFTAVESGNVVRIVPNRDARSLPVPSEDTISTVVLPEVRRLMERHTEHRTRSINNPSHGAWRRLDGH
jgi:general secretion pathway protein D